MPVAPVIFVDAAPNGVRQSASCLLRCQSFDTELRHIRRECLNADADRERDRQCHTERPDQDVFPVEAVCGAFHLAGQIHELLVQALGVGYFRTEALTGKYARKRMREGYMDTMKALQEMGLVSPACGGEPR